MWGNCEKKKLRRRRKYELCREKKYTTKGMIMIPVVQGKRPMNRSKGKKRGGEEKVKQSGKDDQETDSGYDL